MAHAASLLGLRAAVLDLDLMFGNLYDLLGADAPHDMATLIEPSAAGALAESDIVAASMRVAPGVTLWGPVAAPEQAELMARPVELLLDVLRRESDVVLVDTSVFWGDAVAPRWRQATVVWSWAIHRCRLRRPRHASSSWRAVWACRARA